MKCARISPCSLRIRLLTNNRDGWDKTLSFLPYNDQLRSHRKKVHLCLKSEASIKSNDAIQEIEVGHFLLHLLRNPDRLVDHIQKSVKVQKHKVAALTFSLGKLVL